MIPSWWVNIHSFWENYFFKALLEWMIFKGYYDNSVSMYFFLGFYDIFIGINLPFNLVISQAMNFKWDVVSSSAFAEFNVIMIANSYTHVPRPNQCSAPHWFLFDLRYCVWILYRTQVKHWYHLFWSGSYF